MMPWGRKAVELVEELGVSTQGLVVGQRPTTVKTRVVAQGQQVVRFDREQTGVPSKSSLDALLCYLEEHVHTFDAVMVSDYAKGVVSEQLMIRLHQLLHAARSGETKAAVDSRSQTFKYSLFRRGHRHHPQSS